MRFWPPLLCCILLAGLAARLSAEPLRPGEMRLRLTEPRRSALAPRAGDFTSRLCTEQPDVLMDKSGASAYCRDKHSNVPPDRSLLTSPALLRLGLLSIRPGEEGAFQTSLFARELAYRGPQPLDTPCGRWTWSLHLDPRATQPVSAVMLEPAARGASWGTLSGDLRILAQLRFERSEPSRRLVVPVTLHLGLDGPWVAEAGGGRPPREGPPATNLAFFANRPRCFGLSPLTGRICLSPVPAADAPKNGVAP